MGFSLNLDLSGRSVKFSVHLSKALYVTDNLLIYAQKKAITHLPVRASELRLIKKTATKPSKAEI